MLHPIAFPNVDGTPNQVLRSRLPARRLSRTCSEDFTVPTLKEQLQHLTQLKHKLAVWQAVHSLLDEQFISKDGRKSGKAIRVPDCAVEVVPEETIEDVLQAIGDGPITELQEQIALIENQEVVVLGEETVTS